MGNFLVIAAPREAKDEAEKLFQTGVVNARRIKDQKPRSVFQSDWQTDCVQAASFARLNGSGSAIVSDPATGSWICSAGTWFHEGGYAAGDEARLLARILETGAERLAQELEGFFVIVYGDARASEVVIITDVIGSRHCFTRTIGRCQALSTSSLLLASLDDVSLDVIGCEEFLRAGIIFENRTFFREVKKIASARIARFARGQPAGEKRYWSISGLDPEKFDGSQAVRELSEKLVGAARRVGGSFAHPVCDLTGGYDSRAVVAAFLAAGVDFETTVAGAADSADVIVSKGLSQLSGKPHRHFETEATVSPDQLRRAVQLTDGGYDPVFYSRVISLHHRLSGIFDASINGSFGEIGRGYWWELLWPRVGRRERIDARRIAARRYLVEPGDARLFPPETALTVEHFAGVIDRANTGLEGWPNTTQMDNAYLELRMQHWQGRIASSTDQIWPCLSPFMLRSVLETMLQTSARLRYRSLLVRMTMAGLRPDLAAFPLEHGYPALPVTWRTCRRFLPAIKTYAKKAWTKARGNSARLVIRGAMRQCFEPARLQLWREAETRELLDPIAMRLNELVETKRLRDFLASSRETHFPFEQQWNRMLGLEMTLRLLRAETSRYR